MAGGFDLRQLVKMKSISPCTGRSKTAVTPWAERCRRARCRPVLWSSKGGLIQRITRTLGACTEVPSQSWDSLARKLLPAWTVGWLARIYFAL